MNHDWLIKRALAKCEDGRVNVGPVTFCTICCHRGHDTTAALIGCLEDGNIDLDENECFHAYFTDGGVELI